MISQKKIREIARKENRKISKKAINKVQTILEKRAIELITKAKRNADFSGRNVIKDSDIED